MKTSGWLAGASALLAVSAHAQGWVSSYDARPTLENYGSPDWEAAAPSSARPGGALFALTTNAGEPERLFLQLEADGTVAAAFGVPTDRLLPDVTSVIELADGSVVAAAASRSGLGPVYVFRIVGGAVTWTHRIDVQAFGAPMLARSGGGSILLVAPMRNADTSCAIGLVQIDGAGGATEVLRIHSDLDPFTCQTYGVAAVPGGIALATQDGVGQAAFLRLDAFGAIDWQFRATSGCLRIESFSAHPDGSLDITCSDRGTASQHVRLDPDGTLAWNVELPADVQSARSAPAATGGTLVVGLAPRGPAGSNVTWIGRIAADGSALDWSVTLDPGPQAPRDIEQPLLVPMPDGGVMLPFSTAFNFLPAFASPASAIARLDDTGAAPRPCAPWQLAADVLGPGLAIWEPAALRTEVTPLTPVSVSAQAITLRIDEQPLCLEAGCEVDSLEPDEGCGAMASELLPGVSVWGNHCDDVDDWFLVRGCAGVPMILTTSGLGALSDTVIEAWSPDCSQLLASDDNSAGAPASQLVFMPPADGAYSIRVTQAAGLPGPSLEWSLLLDASACGPAPAWDDKMDFVDRVVIHAETDTAFVAEVVEAPYDALHLARFAPDGSGVTVRQHVLTEGPLVTHDLEALRGERILVAGADPSAQPVGLGYLVAIDADGVAAWGARFEMTPDWGRLALLANPDDSAYLINPGPLEPGVMRWSATGALEWSVSLPTTLEVVAAAATPDGDAVLVADLPARGEHEIVRVDVAGTLEWAVRLREEGEVTSIAVVPGGRIVVAIQRYSTARFLALEPDGSLAWSGQLHALDPERIVIGPRGDAAVGFSTGDGHFLGAISDAGQVLFVRERFLDQDIDAAIISARHGGFVRSGAEPGLQRLGPLGELAPGCEGVLERRKFQPYLPDLSPTSVALDRVTFAATTPELLAVDSDLTWWQPCSTVGCRAMEVVASAQSIACEGLPVVLRAYVHGGCDEPDMFEWDLAYDGVSFDADETRFARELTTTAVAPGRVAVRVTNLANPPQVAVGEVTYTVTTPTGGVIEGPGVACEGDCAVLAASAGTTGWAWSNGETTASICAPAGTTVTLQGEDSAGCSFEDTHDVTLVPLPSIAFRATCSATDVIVATDVINCPGCLYAWSSGQTTPDVTIPPGETRTLTVTSSGGCSATADFPGLACPPQEVSPPGAPPLLVSKSASLLELLFSSVPEATSYNVVGNAIGTWLGSGGPACHVPTWEDLGGGLLRFEQDVPANSWFVVTASNASGEGPAGSGSDGIERSTRIGWVGCGPTP